MIRPHASTGLTKHGYGIEQVKLWRAEQSQAGEPSSLEDFFRAHGLCFDCHAGGKNISGILWQDSSGVEHSIELLAPGVPETIASLHEQELKNALRWDYTYTTCEVCGGTGKRPT
jgi:hypothetical protein